MRQPAAKGYGRPARTYSLVPLTLCRSRTRFGKKLRQPSFSLRLGSQSVGKTLIDEPPASYLRLEVLVNAYGFLSVRDLEGVGTKWLVSTASGIVAKEQQGSAATGVMPPQARPAATAGATAAAHRAPRGGHAAPAGTAS